MYKYFITHLEFVGNFANMVYEGWLPDEAMSLFKNASYDDPHYQQLIQNLSDSEPDLYTVCLYIYICCVKSGERSDINVLHAKLFEECVTKGDLRRACEFFSKYEDSKLIEVVESQRRLLDNTQP